MSTTILANLLENPQDIFKLSSGDPTKENIFNELTKKTIDPIVKNYSVLDEIYTDGLDSSQVFGQTKMVLDGIGRQLLGEEIPKIKETIVEEEEEEEEDEEEEEGEEEEEEEQEEEEQENDEDEIDEIDSEEEDEQDVSDQNGDFDDDKETLVESEEENDSPQHKKDAFGLNDGFFDIDEFNKQILALENEPEDDVNEEEIDYFGSMDDEEEDEQMDYYDDFYDKPGQFNKKLQKKQEREEDEISESEFLDDDYDKAIDSARLDLFAEEETKHTSENLSSFEKQQRALQQEIEKLEAELVADKRWTLKGEITSNQRPKESLLEENELSFDRTAKPVPTITEEVTETIEDLIRKRIKNDDFNDLPKRIVTDLSRFHKGPQAEVSEQKSSKSLAELYEDEYNQIDSKQEELNEEEKRQHNEISELFTNVIHKLDALSSAHFIPKPHQSKNIEIKVTDSSPASISMEDAQPLHVSSESRLAPQEIYKIGDDSRTAGEKGKSEVLLKSGLSYSKDELDRDEKQRLRRANKRKKSKIFKEREETKRQKIKQTPTPKRTSNNDVIDTLSKTKNITVVGKKGEKTDVKGNLKKSLGPQTSNSFKL